MDQGTPTLEKQGTGQSAFAPHAYSTREAGLPQSVAPPSWFGTGKRRRAIICGITSTALSALGLLGLALFEQYNGMLTELRADLKHFNDTASEYVKKDRLDKIMDRMKSCYKELNASRATRGELERELKASERAREQMTRQLQRFRERLAYLEGMKAANPTVDVRPAGTETSQNDD